jgi:hypothetical protein
MNESRVPKSARLFFWLAQCVVFIAPALLTRAALVGLTATHAHATLVRVAHVKEVAMSLRQAFLMILAVTSMLATGMLQAAGQPSMKDCFDASNPASAKVCRMQVWATYQAVQLAQARHHMTEKTCQFDANITADALVDSLRADFLRLQAQFPDMAIVAMTIGVLSPPQDCPMGVATKVNGLTTGALLKMCMDGFKAGGDPDVCLGYAAAMRDSLNVLSGYEGADDFFCPPKGGLGFSVKEVVKLLIAETKLDIKAQEARPAAEVMAEALSRKYACH